MRKAEDIKSRLSEIIALSKQMSVEADVFYTASKKQRIDYSGGVVENYIQSDQEKIGIRLIKDHRQAFASTSFPDILSPKDLLERILPQLEVLPEDPFCGLAKVSQLYQGNEEHNFADSYFPDRAALETQASGLWHGVMQVSGIDHSSGASVMANNSEWALMSSNGFFGVCRESRFGQSVSAISGTGTSMEEDYADQSCAYWNSFQSKESFIKEATNRAIARQNPKSMPNISGEVILESRVAGMLIGQICSAMNASQLIRSATFLQDRAEKIADESFTIVDDPFRYRCFNASPFDGEGLPKLARTPILKGKMNQWITDLSCSKALGITPSAQAVRGGLDQPPQPGMSHTVVPPSTTVVPDMVADIKAGIWITDLIGKGLDVVSGHYSCGVAGFRIENGQITHPCRNLTIAADGLDILKQLRVANDAKMRGYSQIPSLYLGKVTIAGS